MSQATNFTPDAPVRCKDFKIGCIGAGMIMAECHFAAYKEAGFPVVAIASRTKANAEKVARALGHCQSPRHAAATDRGQVGRDRRSRLSRRTSSRALIRARAEAAACEGDPRPEAARAVARRSDQAARRGGSRGQDPLGQSEHALRPVDARAEADPGQPATSAPSCSPRSTCMRFRTGSRFCEDYDRLTLSNMSVHHLDALRFLFGDPEDDHHARRARTRARPSIIRTASPSRPCAFPPA